MRILVLVMALCQVADAQSIVISGDGRSIVVSSRSEVVLVPVVPVVTKPEVVVTVPFVSPVTVQTVDNVRVRTRTRYLVSESWCARCPARKALFIRNGWPAQNIITIEQCRQRFGFTVPHVPYEFIEPENVQRPKSAEKLTDSPLTLRNSFWGQQPDSPPSSPNRYVNWAGKTYDMATWSRHCNMRNCPMCNFLDNAAAAYRRSQTYVEPPPNPQSSTPDDVIAEAIAIANLKPDDVVAELGSGSGLPAIRMVQASGCRVVGVEIDPEQVAVSRRNIEAAGLSDRITIIQGDVTTFDPAVYGATVVYAYLETDLLQQIKPQLSVGRLTICPGHFVDGLGFELVGQCWVRRSEA